MAEQKIKAALISVFYKTGIDQLAKTLVEQGITIYSTGGTQSFLLEHNIPCVAVESLTAFPSILGGRVKTLHPLIFGGILGRRQEAQDIQEMEMHHIPSIDLVIVDLYPFQETVQQTKEEKKIIEKIDIGGPAMLRAAAKNYESVVVIASKDDYMPFQELIEKQKGTTTIEQRKQYAAKVFQIVKEYDIAIDQYFQQTTKTMLRYGENPHQKAWYEGNLFRYFSQLHGKELSYNNLVDIEAALQLYNDCRNELQALFLIIKHTNVCGMALRSSLIEAWKASLAGDPESAFGGILLCNQVIDEPTALAIHDIFFEVLIGPSFTPEAYQILTQKKNRILLQLNTVFTWPLLTHKMVLAGNLVQDVDSGNYIEWNEVTRPCTMIEKDDLVFANIICKHLKSNAIVLVKNKQLVGKGCGQTSRIDALRQAIEKAQQCKVDLTGAVLASDAFFPFADCVEKAHQHGITAFIQPGGSVRDQDSIEYCKKNTLAMVITKQRHFKH